MTLEKKKKYAGTGTVQELEGRKESEVGFGCLKLDLSQGDIKVIQEARGQQTFLVKSRTVNIFGFVGHMHMCHPAMKAVTDKYI